MARKPTRIITSGGFTLIELLIVIIVIGILAAIVNSTVRGAQERAYFARALSEFRVMDKALEFYKLDNGDYPPDVNRNVPPGIETYIEKKDADNWPDAPWPGSVYDYDNFDSGGVQTYQISIRFCEIGDPDTCKFPKSEWAEDFEINSSVYFCLEGACKPHPSEPMDYPGYCVNCD